MFTEKADSLQTLERGEPCVADFEYAMDTGIGLMHWFMDDKDDQKLAQLAEKYKKQYQLLRLVSDLRPSP